MNETDSDTTPKGLLWTKLPNQSGYHWFKVTLSDGTIYYQDISKVFLRYGVAHHANDNWFPTVPIEERAMVSWYGPLVCPE